jgi:hypothetical protein
MAGEQHLSSLQDLIFCTVTQGVALGYLIVPRWGLKLITLSHILLEILFLQAMLAPFGAKTDAHYQPNKPMLNYYINTIFIVLFLRG